MLSRYRGVLNVKHNELLGDFENNKNKNPFQSLYCSIKERLCLHRTFSILFDFRGEIKVAICNTSTDDLRK